MNIAKVCLRLAVSCSLTFAFLGCAHNLVEKVPEGKAPSFWWSNAYLLVGLGGAARGETLGEVSNLIRGLNRNAVEVGFSEYDPTQPTTHPSCASLTWSMGMLQVPLAEHADKKYVLYKLPQGHYGFSEGYYAWFERGKVTYVGDYAFAGYKRGCSFSDLMPPQTCPRIVRTTNPQLAKAVLKQYGIPEDSMVIAQEKRGENLFKLITCSP
ncbi:hypothetical protein [Azospirillum brasilense]|uniref:hypothetical protein n=1 Tax=Azospirillum brasilense TaxID=192 RepID=UPI0011C43EC3|nr:hypothetical protein [Azospirillum brasilense]NUB23862.1 hypothetical protein [Azospirillum brasilense]NUB31641.1 hypothetical protein [Azospirillum brasilense]